MSQRALPMLFAVMVAGCGGASTASSSPRPSPTPASTSTSTASTATVTADPGPPVSDVTLPPGLPSTPVKETMYVHYYLFWTKQHWTDRLGKGYPIGQSPLPLPGNVDSSGCNATTKYSGGQLLDIPSEGTYSQDEAQTFDHHIALADAAGIRGFLVSWMGTGVPSQDPTSYGYNSRFDLMVRRVDAYNTAKGRHFGLGLAFASFGNYSRPASEVNADLDYFMSRYGNDPAFVNPFSPKPLVMWLDSRKYSLDTVIAVSTHNLSSMYLVGDETDSSWSRDAPYLDAGSYYWSTENPYSNSRVQTSVTGLGNAIHSSGKKWYAPVIAGYNKELLGGSCVPRNGVGTLDTIWQINASTSPDAWFGISWNELVENTYLEPTQRYGAQYLLEIARLLRT
jgi:hypothetical protein